MTDRPLHVYLHGCSLLPSRRGGWGVVLRHGAHVRTRAGACRDVHAPRMQVQALAEGLHAARLWESPASEVVIHTTSEYIVDNVPRVHRWLYRGRLRQYGADPVKNPDLWRLVVGRLDALPRVRCVLLAKNRDLDQRRATELARYRARQLSGAK